jgi:hypothetical protein
MYLDPAIAQIKEAHAPQAFKFISEAAFCLVSGSAISTNANEC